MLYIVLYYPKFQHLALYLYSASDINSCWQDETDDYEKLF